MQVKRICEQCGKEFYRDEAHVKQNGGKFCSRSCWLKSHSAKPNRICVKCGKNFHAKENEIARGKGKYCSRSCADDGHKAIPMICKYCGTPFHKVPSKRTDYCSAKCYNHAHRIDLICHICGKTFSRSVAYAKNTGGKYCSKRCAGEARAVEHKYRCEVCGKEFVGEANGRKFCSINCRKVGQSGSGNPRWMGGKSFEPYCPKFNEALKEKIRNQYNRVCQKCYEPENGRKLDVHHINFDKQSGCFGKPWNLIPLHHSCHTWTTNHRFEAFHLFVNHWAMNIDINFGGGDLGLYAFRLVGT